MSVKWTNFGKTTITNAGGISAAALSVDVASVDDFPTLGASDHFYAVLRRSSDGLREIVKITLVSSLTLTIVRAIGGTTALAFDQGDNVELRFTAETLEDIVDEQDAEIAAANATAANALATAQAASAVAAATAALIPLAAGSYGAGSIATADLAADAVTGAKLADNAVAREHLADDAVGTDEIEDEKVTYAKLAPNATDMRNYSTITESSEGTVFGPTTKATFINFWAYRTATGAAISLAIWSDTDAAFPSPIDEGQLTLSANADTSESITMAVFIPKGRYYKFVRTAGGSTRVWRATVREFGE